MLPTCLYSITGEQIKLLLSDDSVKSNIQTPTDHKHINVLLLCGFLGSLYMAVLERMHIGN